MINNSYNSAMFGPISIPVVKGIADAVILGTGAAGLTNSGNSDYQTEFLRNHDIVDPREKLIREYISKHTPPVLQRSVPRKTTRYISQPIYTPEAEWYTANPGTIYGGTIPAVIVEAPRVESRIGDAFGVLTGKKTVAGNSTQTAQRDSTQTRRDSTQNRRPEPPSNENDNSGKYFDWSKDMSWSTPTESIFKLIFKPRVNNVHWLRVGANYAPFGLGAYVLGKKWGWWGNNEGSSDSSSKESISNDGWGK